ncbi:MAG TPA: hypothetical protein VMD75_13035 [Candidatus Binataceae bacterium]|nr:hypothetical protein [Candidatus Binataceae bacterium]
MAARGLSGGASGSAEVCPALTDYLPINLRSLLNQRMRSSMRVDGGAMNCAGRESSDAMLREFARAVRHFSAVRAREHWIECAVAVGLLEATLAEGTLDRRSPFICLKCAVFAAPADAQLHCAPGCVVASFGSSSRRYNAPERVRRAIEKFRAERQARGLAHFDLDCYVSKGRMVFTWRPLERPSTDLH